LSAAEVGELLGLEPLPGEGGRWARTWSDGRSTAIYFLMQPGEFSAMHRLGGPELWHHYGGDAARMLLLHPDGTIARPALGDDLAASERPVVPVPGGVWMGAETLGEWTLVGTTMAPPFDGATFELGDPDRLIAEYPEAAGDIRRLTRARPA
jgi:predicted cupin superfamily sugar epimerase